MVEEPGSSEEEAGVTEESSLADESEAVFSVLGDETRLRILLELADRSEPEQAAFRTSFSELRRAVGVEDAGRFNYHLQQLQDTFVVKDEEGYRATVAGLQVASSIHAGRYASETETRSAETEYDCPTCSGPLSVCYEEEMVVLQCEREHVWFSFPVPAGATIDRSTDELLELAIRRASVNVELARTGQCPRCWGPTAVEVRADDGALELPGGDVPRADVTCERCWLAYYVPLPQALGRAPPVVAFYEEHGLDPQRATFSDRNVISQSETVLHSTDPIDATIEVTLEEERLRLEVGAGVAIREATVEPVRAE